MLKLLSNQIRFIFFTVIFSIAISQAHSLEGCMDYRGLPIPTILNDSFPSVAAAITSEFKEPRIIINPTIFNKYTEGMKQFIYWHECGHHALGQLLQSSPVTILQEQEADCFGVRVPLTIGRIKHQDIESLQLEIEKLGPGGWQHFPGKTRALNIKKCLGDGINVNKWNSCKTQYDTNLELLKKSIPVLKQLSGHCNKFGKNSTQCLEVKQIIAVWDKEIKNTIGKLDNECPFIMDPTFIGFISQYAPLFNEIFRD